MQKITRKSKLRYIWIAVIFSLATGSLFSLQRTLSYGKTTEFFHEEPRRTAEKQNIFKQRRHLLKAKCREYRNPFRQEYRNLYGSDVRRTNLTTTYFRWKEKQFLLLTVLKGGSTSWPNFFAKNNITWSKYCIGCEREKLEKVILQVRHPLERLISTYRNLFEENGWRSFVLEQDTLGEGVEEYFSSITWPKFINSIVLKHSLYRNIDLNLLYEGYDSWVFESILLMHWAPYWFTTGFCTNQLFPDIILHMETLGDDFKKLREILGFPTDLVLPHFAVKGRVNYSLQHSSNLIETYYSQLTKMQVMKLSEMYRLDLELFGYSPSRFIQAAA